LASSDTLQGASLASGVILRALVLQHQHNEKAVEITGYSQAEEAADIADDVSSGQALGHVENDPMNSRH